MTLYIYDHCPYCVKARMIFGLKKQRVQLKTLLNDDEKTPKSLIGVKMVPILEYQPGQFMPESRDIISYIDKLDGNPIVQDLKDAELTNWLDKNSRLAYQLAMPLWAQAPLKEFETMEARNYFQKKKEAFIGSFEDCLEQIPANVEQMEEELDKLESLFQTSGPFFKEQLSFHDFHLFAFLRALTIVEVMLFPKKVENYMEKLSKLSKVPLHHSIAL